METTMNFCRVCLVPDEEGEFTSIFANNGKYAKKIHFLTGVQVRLKTKVTKKRAFAIKPTLFAFTAYPNRSQNSSTYLC